MGKIYKNGVLYTNDANTLSTELTWEEYSQLTDAEKLNGTYYYITNVDPFVESVAPHGFTPIGTIISVMGKTAPKNYLVCDGTVYNISEFPELAHYFMEQFGSNNYFGGDGTTTFAVPDLQGEFLRGAGTNSHANQGSGANVGEHQDGTELPYFLVAKETNWSMTARLPSGMASGDSVLPLNSDGGKSEANTRFINNTFTSTAASSGLVYTTKPRPTNTSVLYCIAPRNIYLKPENAYSTDEQVVGTWIDGKPIYQKTLFSNTGSGVTNVDVTNLNIDKCIDVEGFVIQLTGNAYNCAPIAYISEDSDWSTSAYFSKVNEYIGIRCKNYVNSDIYITIRYTKTID